MHQNVRSISKNIGSLEALLHQLKNTGGILPSVIGVTEASLSNSEQVKLKKIQLDDYKFVHSGRKTAKGGGVGFYIHHDIEYNEISDIKLVHAENKWIEIKVNGLKNNSWMYLCLRKI